MLIQNLAIGHDPEILPT